MKVGILSMQQITNYGSFLQAYGLKSILESLGHSVEFINIVPGKQLREYKKGKFHRLSLIAKRLMVRNPFKQIKYSLLLHRRFDSEFKPELGVIPGENNSRFDAVVIGSDEVFNIAQQTWFGYSPQLFGQGLNTDKVISYAACFGATTTDILHKLGLSEEIAGLLNNFHAISVRDRNSCDTVKKLTGKMPELNIDPVLAYDFGKEIRLPERDDDYMLIYTYPGRMNSPREIKEIKAYARRHNLKIISIADYFDWVDEVVTPHPFEVLGYFKKAKCIFTDTFHGSVMSMKYNRPFAVIVRDMNSNKLSFLMKQFGLESRIASDPAQISDILNNKINFDSVNLTIADEREKSLQYLSLNL